METSFPSSKKKGLGHLSPELLLCHGALAVLVYLGLLVPVLLVKMAERSDQSSSGISQLGDHQEGTHLRSICYFCGFVGFLVTPAQVFSLSI